MTTFQKVIKYGAIALAIYLCILIIGIIVLGITSIFGITKGIEMFENNKDNNSVVTTKWEEEYSNITNLDIDLSVCKLNIKKGDTFKVEASDVSKQFICRAEGNRLKIEDENIARKIFNIGEIKTEITVYIPESTNLREIEIDTGANETNIEYLKSDRINLNMGMGKCHIGTMSAKYAEIDTGAGEVTIENANIEELELDAGVGKVALTSKITKRADISSGVGKMELDLIGSSEDYKIRAESGLGNFVVNGKTIKDNQTIGNGNATIKIEAGVGETIVNFKEGLRDGP